MSDISSIKLAQLIKDAIQDELHITVNVFDSKGRLLTSPAKQTVWEAQIDIRNLSQNSNRIIPVFDGDKTYYYLDCGRELPHPIVVAIKMFARVAMGFDRKELKFSGTLKLESALVMRILEQDAMFYHDDIVASAAELGYNLNHPMAMIVTALEENVAHCLNMEVGYQSATNEAKYGIIKILKNHLYMNRQDIVAFAENNYLIVLKAIDDISNRGQIYQTMRKLAEAIDDVLKAYRIFKYYISPAELLQGFEYAHVAWERAKDYISYAKKVHLSHSVIQLEDILYYAVSRGLPEEYMVEVIRPKAQELASKNQEMVEGLMQCFDAYVENGFNIANVAENVYLHRNTIKNRLEKIYSLTGFDPMEDFKSALINKLIFQQYKIEIREEL